MSVPSSVCRIRSAASLVAILNSVVLGTGLALLTGIAAGGFRPWDVAVGVAGAGLVCAGMLWFEYLALNGSPH